MLSGRTLGDTPTISVAVGITVGLIASFVQSAGLTLQRKSHLQNELLPESQRKPERRRPLWLVGFTIFLTSNILGSIFQIASLPVVILAPLGAVSLLWNALFARLLLGDVFSQYMVIGTLLIAGGAVLIALFGMVPEPTHSLDDLLRLFGRKEFVVYFSLLGAVLGIVLFITHIAESRLPAEVFESPSLTPNEDHPVTEPLHALSPTSERTPLLMDNKSVKSIQRDKNLARTKVLIAISYASASGILSGMCLIFAKSGVELLILSITDKNQFGKWQSWVLVGGLVAFSLLQLWYLHKSLILADPTLVCPLAFCFYNLSSIFNGLVYYDQFGLLSTLHLLLVLLGIVILLAGVWAVSVQPGGSRRVEVGTWQEGAEVLTAEAIGAESAIAVPTVVLDEPSRAGSLASHIAAARRRTGMMTDDGQLLSSPIEEIEGISPLASDTSPRNSTAFPALRSPTLRSPTRHSPTRNRYSDLGHGHPRKKWSSIFEHQAGTTAGLSIGLSATSPGFALVPRRRVSSSAFSVVSRGENDGGSGGLEGSDGNVVGGRGRRVVSESHITRRGTSDVESGMAGGSGNGVGNTNNAAGAPAEGEGKTKFWQRLKEAFK